MFQFPAFAPHSHAATGLQPAGLPHSDMRGSIPVCGSPRLFAAYHVLHRLRKPRHPPFALLHFLSNESLCLVLPIMKLQSISLNSKKLELSSTDFDLFLLLYLVSLSMFSMNWSRNLGRGRRYISKRPRENTAIYLELRMTLVTHFSSKASASRIKLQKGGVPATPSGTATLLRLSPNHRFRPRPLLLGHGLQAPPAFMA